MIYLVSMLHNRKVNRIFQFLNANQSIKSFSSKQIINDIECECLRYLRDSLKFTFLGVQPVVTILMVSFFVAVVIILVRLEHLIPMRSMRRKEGE